MRESTHDQGIFPTVGTIKRILEDASRFPVLRPKVESKRAKVFSSDTKERPARANLLTTMDMEILKPSHSSQRNCKKETKKVFIGLFCKREIRLFFRHGIKLTSTQIEESKASVRLHSKQFFSVLSLFCKILRKTLASLDHFDEKLEAIYII